MDRDTGDSVLELENKQKSNASANVELSYTQKLLIKAEEAEELKQSRIEAGELRSTEDALPFFPSTGLSMCEDGEGKQKVYLPDIIEYFPDLPASKFDYPDPIFVYRGIDKPQFYEFKPLKPRASSIQQTLKRSVATTNQANNANGISEY
jgi:hypothetical protein